MDDSITNKNPQKIFDKWFENLPKDKEKFYSFLSDNVKKFQTFDLLSYFSYYNHLHDTENYSDFRGDKHFYVPEVLALLCLKNEFQMKSSVSKGEYMELIIEMQKTVLNYCGRCDALNLEKHGRDKSVVSDVTNLLSQEGKQIRNPGLPDHHLIFVEKLFSPIEDQVKALMGFKISDSVTIRKSLPDLINEKCHRAVQGASKRANKYVKEIVRYRKKKIVENNSDFTKEELEEYSVLPYKKLRSLMQNHFLNELFYEFGQHYSFTAKELSDFTKLDEEVVIRFLNTFSCSFPSLGLDDEIYDSVSILNNKPFLTYDDKYIIPSMPLLNWAIEEVVEAEIRKNQKRHTKYTGLKHDFLLDQGLDYFNSLLPTATLLKSNLYYDIGKEEHETDGIIIYDKILFIIEAKGHRITKKAKQGHKNRTEDHLKDIIRDSYSQGLRTLNFIEDNSVASFRTKDGTIHEVSRKDFNEIILVSLTLEPIGNLSMLVKATNETGFFEEAHFPWVISLYDLAVLADLLENPILFIQYIKRRKLFLSSTASPSATSC